MHRLWLFGILVSIAGIVPGGSARAAADDIVDALNSLPGVSFREIPLTEDPKIPAGYRRFDITIDQPVDHFRQSARFQQHLSLLHKGLNEPVVLHTSGYKIFAVKLSAVARSFETNQIQVEHRFFAESVPAVLDWAKLDIVQSANDFHRVVQTFKKIYSGRWLNTGASKGGMTSVYHRRFFPTDLDGTIADVAPLSFSTEDSRYIDFVDSVGGEKYRECRAKLESLQLTLLRKRAEILKDITGSFVYLGGKSVSFEHAVIELPFAFWQYKNPEDTTVGCSQVPGPDATDTVLRTYLEKVNAISGYGDSDLFSFMPYYFQAATQLGAPASKLSHLEGLRLHDYQVNQYVPPGVAITHTDHAMRDVERWVREQADQILFVYGEFDPWSAAAFPRSDAAADFQWHLVPAGNHGSNLFALPEPTKQTALAAVSRWLGKAPVSSWSWGETLDSVEFEIRQRAHLP